ncbi:ERF family protein [bacterium]|nr:ERF family protein [bacterium]
MQTSNTIANLSKALLAAQLEMPHPKKNAQNPHLRNKFADLPGVIDTIKTVMNKHGIVVVQGVSGTSPKNSDEQQDVCVSTRLIHGESGEWLEDEVWQTIDGAKGMNLSQSIGSAITYLRRYSISAMAFVASEPDNDGNEGKGSKTPMSAENFDL